MPPAASNTSSSSANSAIHADAQTELAHHAHPTTATRHNGATATNGHGEVTHATPSLRPRTLLERLTAFIRREPGNREDLLESLHDAHENSVLDADALSMIEGVLQVAELRARDLMVPRLQMDVIDINEGVDAWIGHVLETAHSRFPVIEGDRDHVIGILLAKDLLRYYTDVAFDVRANLRPVVFIPESKPLNVLLRDFRANRNHMAIVVNEYGGVSGLITIEDVLEQIVGDIADEYDYDEHADQIVAEADGRFRIKALTEISVFNQKFGTTLPDTEFDTIGGFIAERLGHVPRRGDATAIDGLHFEVLRADARQALLFQLTRLDMTAPPQATHGSNSAAHE